MNQYLADHDIPDDPKEDLTLDHFNLLEVIGFFQRQEGYCSFTDKELGERLECDTTKIKRLIRQLDERGYIVRQRAPSRTVRGRKIYIRNENEA
jgi:DNA-binding MarR family transcriptional regulator